MHNYIIYIGRDLLYDKGINLSFSVCVIAWSKMHAEIPMKPKDNTLQESLYIDDPMNQQSESEPLSKIPGSKYKPIKLCEYIDNHKNSVSYNIICFWAYAEA